MNFDELAKDGLKAMFTSGGGGSLSAGLGAAAFKASARLDCGTSLLGTGGLCRGLQWQVLGMTFHSAGAAAAFFGPAIGAVFVLAWILKLIHDVVEPNAGR